MKRARKSSGAVRRKRRTPEDILGRIVRAASAEFKRHGYAGTTTAVIARKADVTEAQLFRYFGSKANLFRETVFKPLDQHFLNFINKHMGKEANVRVGTAHYTSELQRFLSEHSETLMSLVVAQIYDHGDTQGVGEINSLRTYFDHGEALMTLRMRDKPKVPPKLMVRVSFAAVLACVMFRSWIFPPGIASDEEIKSAINDFILEGIAANYARIPR